MRTRGTLIRTLSLLSAAGAAVYFWSAALSGTTAVELLRGGNQAPVAAAVVAPKAPRAAAPTPRPAPARRPPVRRTPAIRQLEPVPRAIADAIAYVGATDSVPAPTLDPYRALIVTRPPAGPVETPLPGASGTVTAAPQETSPETPAIVLPAGVGGTAQIGVEPATSKALPATAPQPEPPAAAGAPSAEAPEPPTGAAQARTTSPATTPRPTPLGRQTTPQPAAPTPTPTAPAAPTPVTAEPQTVPSTTPSGTSTTRPPVVLGVNNPVTSTPGSPTPATIVTPTPPTPPTIVTPTPPTPPTIVAPTPPTPPTIVTPTPPTPPTIVTPTPPTPPNV